MGELFTVEFQLKFLFWFCRIEKSKYYLEYLQPYYFSTPLLQWLAEVIINLRKKQFPLTKLMLETEYKVIEHDNFSDQEIKEFQIFLQWFDHEEEFEFDYISNLYVKYVNSLNLRKLLNDQDQLIEEGNWDDLASLISNKKNVIQDTELIKQPWAISNFEELFKENAILKVNMNIIDNKMKGLFRKELFIIMADTGCGKSAFMTFLGSRLVRNKYKVLHVTLELSMARTLARYGAALTDDEDNMTYEKIELARYHPEEFIRYLMKLQNRYGLNPSIIEYPPNVCTIGEIEKLINLSKPDVLIVDYLDLLKIPQQFSDRRYALAFLTTELRRLASEYDIHVMTASQSNRTQRNKREVDISGIAEDYEKARIADNVIALGMNKQDKLKSEVIINIPKTRNAEQPELERHRLDFSRLRYIYMEPYIRMKDRPLAGEEDDDDEDSEIFDVKLKNRKWAKNNGY